MSNRLRLPNRRHSSIVEFEGHDGRRYRASGTFDQATGELREVFLDAGTKSGAALQQHVDNAAILISLALQHGIPLADIRHSIAGPIDQALDLLASGAR